MTKIDCTQLKYMITFKQDDGKASVIALQLQMKQEQMGLLILERRLYVFRKY